eukprot:415274_1
MASAIPAAVPGGGPDDVNLQDKINMSECYCLNELPQFTWRNLFKDDDRLVLRSDADEQLMLHIAFQETVKIHSIDFCSPKPDGDEAPTTIKLYINRDSLGFSDAEDTEAIQELKLSPEDLQPDRLSPLKFVKFQRVSSLSIFVEENAGGDATSLSGIKIYGTPVATTNMKEWKKNPEGGMPQG